MPWVDVHKPTSLATHFVHHKKVEEVQSWFAHGCKGRILVLTGPSGSGKTATIALVAKHRQLRIREWITPMDLIDKKPTTSFMQSDFDFIRRRQNQDDDGFNLIERFAPKSHVDQFQEYILRASLYDAKDVIILVEDMPNVFYKKVELFHELLKNYQIHGGAPLIFIASESYSAEYAAYKLFPMQLLQKLRITQISFNPVAVTFITKFLRKICEDENQTNVSKDELDELALAANGDMRWAINNLEFKLLAVNPEGNKHKQRRRFGSPTKKTIAQKKKDAAKNFLCGKSKGKDEFLFLFHGVGKVLYAKRDLTQTSKVEEELYGTSFEVLARPNPLLENPDEIASKVQVTPTTFFNFLGHNYLSFYSDMDEVARASELLSDAHEIMANLGFYNPNGKDLNIRDEMALSLAIRGLMHSNTKPVISRFKPLQKPQSTQAHKKGEENIAMAREMFPLRQHPLPEDFCCNELPYFARNPSKFTVRQVATSKEIGVMRPNSRGRRESLDANEVVEDDPNKEENEEDGGVKKLNDKFAGIKWDKDALKDDTDLVWKDGDNVEDEEYEIEDYDNE